MSSAFCPFHQDDSSEASGSSFRMELLGLLGGRRRPLTIWTSLSILGSRPFRGARPNSRRGKRSAASCSVRRHLKTSSGRRSRNPKERNNYKTKETLWKLHKQAGPSPSSTERKIQELFPIQIPQTRKTILLSCQRRREKSHHGLGKR